MSETSKKSSQLGGINDDHDFVVRIPYKSELDIHKPHTFRDRLNTWNESCAFAVEHFGLANGELYSCKMCDEWIEFWFLSEKDAMFFQLACG
jgi:hypothetical protein